VQPWWKYGTDHSGGFQIKEMRKDKFGGSTVVLLFEKNKNHHRRRSIKQHKGYETERARERIGVSMITNFRQEILFIEQ
jgi:phosphatidylserine decarboxylase